MNDIVEFRNTVMFLNIDQINDYVTFENEGNTYVRAGVFVSDILDDGWVVSNMTETSDPELDAILVFDSETGRGTIGILLSTVSDDKKYAFSVSTSMYNETLDETQIFATAVRVNILLGYVNCPIDETLDIWAIDFNPDGMVGEVLNADAISVSITDILMTSYMERPRRPSYGTPLSSMLFSNMNAFNGEDLLDEVIGQIEKWEKRVIVESDKAGLEIFPSKHAVIISIPYYVPEQRKRVLYRKLLQE